MAKNSTKATRKFASSGQLQKKIQSRRKHQQIKKKIERKGAGKRNAKGKEREHVDKDGGDDGEDEEEGDVEKGSKKFKGMSVDDFLGGGFMENDEDDEDSGGEEDEDEDEDEADDEDDDASFASVDDLDDDEGAMHMDELSKLAEKDPEFYKYLQENDAELLDFDNTGADIDLDEEEEEEDVEMEEDKTPVLTSQILKKWQKALLEQRSLRALRKLLIAFRSAAHMNEEDQVTAWTIDSSSIYNKLITTALTYTPVVLAHHVPYKTLPNGKFKAPTQTQKLKTLQKMILSYFHNIIHIVSQLSDPETVKMAMNESAKLVPYIVSSRRTVKMYLKSCLDLWSTAGDSVRIAAFLAVRKLASAPDESIMDMVLKSTYLTLIRSSKSTSVHTLPSITLMKNSALEIFCLNHAVAYQHAFGYVRQLAIHLRTSMKMKTKESYKQVYNWQFVHSIDFWSIVLARACDVQAVAQRGAQSDLQPLIYPFVQVATGAIKLLSHSRSYPFHMHMARSLVHLSNHTHTYIPLAPHLLPILTSVLTGSKPKSSTVRPLDFETNIRAPQQYLSTRVYTESLAEEGAFLFAEWLTTRAVHAGIAFPEVVVPITVILRKTLKSAKSRPGIGKEAGIIKGFVERVEESARWMTTKRTGVMFAPGQMKEVGAWEEAVSVDESPLGKYLKVQRKARDKRRKLVEKARDGENEILED